MNTSTTFTKRTQRQLSNDVKLHDLGGYYMTTLLEINRPENGNSNVLISYVTRSFINLKTTTICFNFFKMRP